MPAAKKVTETKTKRAKTAAKRTSRPAAGGERPAVGGGRPGYDRKAPRSEAWSPEWLALFDAYDGQLVFARDVLKITRQTLTRWGLWGAAVPEGSKMLIRMYAAAKGLKPPV